MAIATRPRCTSCAAWARSTPRRTPPSETAAIDRVRDYVKTVLTADERGSLKSWLTLLLNPPTGGDAAAKLLRNDFQPLAGFLKQLLTLVPSIPRPMPRARLSAAEARRIALAAQGFAEPRRPTAGPSGGCSTASRSSRSTRSTCSCARTTCRASRASAPTTASALDQAAHYAPRRLFEYWGHEASPDRRRAAAAAALADGARRTTRRGAACGASRRSSRSCSRDVLERVRERGPLAARELAERAPARSRARGGTGRDVKRAIEWLFWSGQVTSRAGGAASSASTTCPSACSRARCSPRRRPTEADAQRELVAIAARALGVAARPRPARLLPPAGRRDARGARRRAGRGGRAAAGRGRGLGRRRPTCTATRACRARRRRPRAARPVRLAACGSAARVERLFGFRYRLEIYVPQPKRVHGYYVLPFLLGDRLVARVDLKADRQAGRLLVHAAHAEPDAPPETAAALARGARAAGRLARAHASRAVTVRPAQPSSATRISAPAAGEATVDRRRRRPRLGVECLGGPCGRRPRRGTTWGCACAAIREQRAAAATRGRWRGDGGWRTWRAPSRGPVDSRSPFLFRPVERLLRVLVDERRRAAPSGRAASSASPPSRSVTVSPP